MKALYVGIDAGWETHSVVVLDENGTSCLEKEFSTSTKDLTALRDKLLGFGVGLEDVHVAIEDPTQPVVDVLIESGFSVMSINPKRTDRLREARWVANPKDDRRDALVIADELRIRPGMFWPIEMRDPLMRALREVTRARDNRQQHLQQMENYLRDLLRRYYPQYLALKWEVGHRIVLELLMLIPEPAKLEKVSLERIAQSIGQGRKHNAEEVKSILSEDLLKLAPELSSHVADIIMEQVAMVRELQGQLRRFDDKIKALLEEISELQKADEEGPSDVEIIQSLPGIGFLLAATILSEGAYAVSTRDRELLRRKSIAPVTSRTGKQGRVSPKNNYKETSVPVRQRYQGNKALQRAMYHMGRCASVFSPHYKQRYAQLRQRGKTHGRACRQVADQQLLVLFAMLRHKTLYDPSLHGATRQTGYSPVEKSA